MAHDVRVRNVARFAVRHGLPRGVSWLPNACAQPRATCRQGRCGSLTSGARCEATTTFFLVSPVSCSDTPGRARIEDRREHCSSTVTRVGPVSRCLRHHCRHPRCSTANGRSHQRLHRPEAAPPMLVQCDEVAGDEDHRSGMPLPPHRAIARPEVFVSGCSHASVGQIRHHDGPHPTELQWY